MQSPKEENIMIQMYVKYSINGKNNYISIGKPKLSWLEKEVSIVMCW